MVTALSTRAGCSLTTITRAPSVDGESNLGDQSATSIGIPSDQREPTDLSVPVDARVLQVHARTGINAHIMSAVAAT